MSFLRFKFAIAKIRFLKAASKIISFIATNYTFKHNNSNILVHLATVQIGLLINIKTVCKLILKCKAFLKNIHQPEILYLLSHVLS